MPEASTTMTPALPQHIKALGRANEVRLARAVLKKGVRSGRVSVCAVIRSCPPEAEGMTLLDLLDSLPRWGTYRCSKLLEELGLAEHKHVGTLTERQRNVLIEKLRERGAKGAERAVTTGRAPH